MAWPGQCLWICASQLHQVCIEVLPHPREGNLHLNAVFRECLHTFHHYQLYDRLASIGSRHHDGLRCLTSAVCHVYGTDPTRHHRHFQRWRNQKWRCHTCTTIAGFHERCSITRPVQSGNTKAEVRTGTKWPAANAVQEAEASLQVREVIRPTQTGRAGLGSTPHRWFSHEDSRGRRNMVITELKMFEEEKRVATAAGQAKQCAWMNWEEAEVRKLSWSSLMTMEPLALSFLLRSIYNLLLTPANHKQWGFTGDDTCTMCKSARGTLRHVLSSCRSSLQMYTWRYNRVLAILAELTETQGRVTNEQPTQHPNPCISFLQEGEAPNSTSQQTTRAKVPRSSKGLEDGCWPKRSSSLSTSHCAYPGTTRLCDRVRHSQARHHCRADCTLGEEHGRGLREEETPVQESTHGMWRQRMGLSSDVHRGWLSWLHRSNINLIPDQVWTNEQGQTEGHTAASNSSGKGIQLDLVQSQKEHHSMTKSRRFHWLACKNALLYRLKPSFHRLYEYEIAFLSWYVCEITHIREIYLTIDYTVGIWKTCGKWDKLSLRVKFIPKV